MASPADDESLSLVAISHSIRAKFVNLKPSGTCELPAQPLREGLLEQSDRFELWAINIGAYSLGHSSLDYRSRDATGLQDFARKLPKDLDSYLTAVHDVLSDLATQTPSGASDSNVVSKYGSEKANRANELLSPAPAQHDEPLTGHDAVDCVSTGAESIGEDSSVESFGSYTDDNLLQNILTNIADSIDRLYRLSIQIRNPRNRIGTSKARSFRHLDKETNVDLLKAFWPFDKAHVQELFAYFQRRPPSDFEDHYLVHRLASANLQRRQQFAHWHRHHMKLKQASRIHPQDLHDEMFTDQAVKPLQLNTHLEPSTIYSRPTTATYLPPLVISADISTGDAKSLISDHTLLIEDRDIENDRIPIPPLPRGYRVTKEFECLYCFIICGRGTSQEDKWKSHVLRDLRPYVCTYPGCQMQEQQFDAFHDWVAHEVQVHETENASSNELTKALPHNSDQRSISREVEVSSVRKECPICLKGFQKEDLLRSHIAFHLRRIATFALPHTTAFDDDKASNDTCSGRAKASFDDRGPSEDLSSVSYQSSIGSKPFAEGGPDATNPSSHAAPTENLQAGAELSMSALQELDATSSDETSERLHAVKDFLTGLQGSPPPKDDASDLRALASKEASITERDTQKPSRPKGSGHSPSEVGIILASTADLLEDISRTIERNMTNNADLPNFVDSYGRYYSSSGYLRILLGNSESVKGDGLEDLRNLNIDVLRQLFDNIELEMAETLTRHVLKLTSISRKFEEWAYTCYEPSLRGVPNFYSSITKSVSELEQRLSRTYNDLSQQPRRAALPSDSSSAWPSLCPGAIKLINSRDEGIVESTSTDDCSRAISARSRSNLESVGGYYKWWYCGRCDYRCEFHVRDEADMSLSDANLILPSTRFPDLYFRETLWAKFHICTANVMDTYRDGPEVLGCVICVAEGKPLRNNIFRPRGELLRHIRNHHFDILPSEVIRDKLRVAVGETIPRASTFDMCFIKEQKIE